MPTYSAFNGELAASITRTASKQTYYTLALLADSDHRYDAYRAYAYFRWVDDQLDQDLADKSDRLAFAARQQSLINRYYAGERPPVATDEEAMLASLISNDQEKNSGLQCYIRNMMAVMTFDVERRGQLISSEQLCEYTCWLATAVTEYMHHFIGHNCATPRCESRYLAVSAAHITHMLRDTVEDVQAGYFNIPREFIQSHNLDPQDTRSEAYRQWVRSRVELARSYFRAGTNYMARVESLRCRLAGFAYIARFEWVLGAIERDSYCLRPEYSERKSLGAALQMAASAVSLAVSHHRIQPFSRALPAR